MKLADIHMNYMTDKGTQHSYIESYDRLLSPYQSQDILFCEIGCLGCGSLKMFETFFPNGKIVGVDNWIQSDNNQITLSNIGYDQQVTVDELKQDIKQNHPRIELITCDSTNSDQVNKELSNFLFDIIVDDGDHWHEAQLKTFENFFPLLKSNGIYIVEDVRHYDQLAANIEQFLNHHQLDFQVKVETFFKNNWDDDVLVIVTPRKIIL